MRTAPLLAIFLAMCTLAACQGDGPIGVNGRGTTAVQAPVTRTPVPVPPAPEPLQADIEACSNGTAVPDPEINPGLVMDCAILWGVRFTLAAAAPETFGWNWDSDISITEWWGIEVVQGRVTAIDLNGFTMGRSLDRNIPPSLGGLAALRKLALDGNSREGEIPRTLGNLSNLEELSLRSNRLTGEIPSFLGNLTNLQALDLSRNQFTGEIPFFLGNLTNLQVLDLHHNQLTGEIPLFLGNLTSMRVLGLNWNQLTGEIPPFLGNLTNLTVLELGSNQLTGEIPPFLGNLTKLQVLDLHGNQLTGEIPPFLGNLTTLQELALGSNQLTGEVPLFLGDLANLERLGLGPNQLTGEVPLFLGDHPRLKSLYISGNDLRKVCLPDEFRNLTDAVPGLPFCDFAPKLRELREARTLWESKGSDDYIIVYEWSCFSDECGRQIKATVKDGGVVSATWVDSGEAAPPESYNYLTIDGIFERIERAFSSPKAVYDGGARYHPDLGYPTGFGMDPSRDTVDEEYGLRVHAYYPAGQ